MNILSHIRMFFISLLSVFRQSKADIETIKASSNELKKGSDAIKKNKTKQKIRKKRKIKLLILMIIIIDLVLLIGFWLKIINFNFLKYFYLILFIELVIASYFIITFFVKKYLKNNYRKISIKKTLKRIRLYIKENNVDAKNLPCILVLGEAGSGKSRMLLKSGFRLLTHELIGRTIKDVKLFFSRNTFAICTNINYEVKSLPDIEINYLLDLLLKKNENPISSILITIPYDSLSDCKNSEIQGKAKSISDEVYKIQIKTNRIIPVYFFLTKCDKIVGINEFFDTVSELEKPEVFGYTASQKLDSIINLEQIKTDLDDFSSELKNIREKSLSHIKMPNAFNNRINHTDKFYPFAFYIEQILENVKLTLHEVFSGHKSNNLFFPFRGVYFTGSLGNGDNENINTNDSATNTGSKLQSNSTIIHPSNIISKVITAEVNTLIPLSKAYVSKRRKNRVAILILLVIALFLQYFSYSGYKILKAEVGKIKEGWEIVSNSQNWNYNQVLPAVGYSYNIGKNEPVYSTTFDSSPEKNIIKFNPYIKFTNGKSVFEVIGDLIDLSSSEVSYPPAFFWCKYFSHTNIKTQEIYAARSLYLTSIVYPVIDSTLDTILYSNSIAFNKSSYNAFLVIMRVLGYLREETGSATIFMPSNAFLVHSKASVTHIMKFLIKNNSTIGTINLEKIFTDSENSIIKAGKLTPELSSDNHYGNISNWRWPNYKKIQNHIKMDRNIHNFIDLEFAIVNRLKNITRFPLQNGLHSGKFLSYENMLQAKSLLDTINCPLDLYQKNKQYKKLINWVLSARKLCNSLINRNYYRSTEYLYLQNYSDTEKSVKKNKVTNASEIFVAAKLITGQDENFIGDFTRSSKDVELGTINNNRSYSKRLCLYETYSQLEQNNPQCVLKLPKYWTNLFLLFDGPENMPPNYKYKYWATWKKAVHVQDNIWKTKIRIFREGIEYNFFLKFTLDPSIASSQLDLINLLANEGKKSLNNDEIEEAEVKQNFKSLKAPEASAEEKIKDQIKLKHNKA